MKKGIVMDVNDEYITMLTPEGEFVKAKYTKANYEIGEEMFFFPINERVSNTSKQHFFQVKKWRYALASSLVAILLLSLIIPFSSRNEVYAYMSIDINPSFEVGLDDDLHVVSLEALNDEAKKLMESIPDWKNSTLDSITEKIIQHSKDKGYLEDGKQVLITTVVAATHNVNVDQELQQGIEDIKAEYKKEQIAVSSITSTVETRKAAKEEGISTGKLLIKENKVPKPVEKKKLEPAGQDQNTNNNQGNADKQKELNEFRNNQKEKAKEVQEGLKEKKEEIRDKVKNNIENSNMPDHIKEKKFDKMDEKWEKKQRKQEEKWERKQKQEEKRYNKENRGNNENNGKRGSGNNHNNGNHHKGNNS
ncbi:anti-sigma factor domain-containing protein [Bacillus sp. REN16]|uniref:anti-sigma factor domain-containing protein n=1 Tax=Bacillus sp. REN16 TaxID=2887296 RepID=UPI001E58D5E9|nr:anti-sigma factor domain-containing protein [Bacillus sp. REN16]MCC3358676.1 anti-sigma factor domain-containing protein [Bacillus sp. REN16]